MLALGQGRLQQNCSSDALDAWGLRQFEMQNSRGCEAPPPAAPAAQGRVLRKLWNYSPGHAQLRRSALTQRMQPEPSVAAARGIAALQR